MPLHSCEEAVRQGKEPRGPVCAPQLLRFPEGPSTPLWERPCFRVWSRSQAAWALTLALPRGASLASGVT